MARKPRVLVLDSWSVIAYLEDEPAGAAVAELMAVAHEEGTSLLMTAVNVGEVWYILARKTSEADADRSIDELQDLGIGFREVDWELARNAARFKANHKMSYADGFAAALALREKGAVLITGDREFEQVENEIRVHWV